VLTCKAAAAWAGVRYLSVSRRDGCAMLFTDGLHVLEQFRDSLRSERGEPDCVQGAEGAGEVLRAQQHLGILYSGFSGALLSVATEVAAADHGFIVLRRGVVVRL
jgi:hypothetical protein